MNRSRYILTLNSLILSLALVAPAVLAAIKNGQVEIRGNDLTPGNSIDLTGSWLYRPGYLVSSEETPAASRAATCSPVPVPQLLNRIHWWLDDSEDFQKWETARLKALGFDTDRAEDGWYYLELNAPDLGQNRRLFLRFDGVAMISRTYCNNQFLGEHKGMFSRFEYELTPHLTPGTNLIAVFVSMEKIPASSLAMGEAVTVNLTASKVRTMSKGMFGPLSPNHDNRAYDLHGIWQPAQLVVRGTAQLEDVWFKPSLDGAEVRIQAKSLTNSQPASVRARWVDYKTGGDLAELCEDNIHVSSETTSHTLTLRNVKPRLWTPAEPNLYMLDVTLEAAGKVVDRWRQPVGFRTFEVRGNQFLLNGKTYWLRGANHLPYGKNPFDPKLARKLIRALHDANIRITRTHATPWNEAWLSAADEIGLGVSLEGIRPWALSGKIGATPPELFAHWLMENEDVVKRARNHPSVFIYTVGNEMMLRDTRNLEKWRQLSDVVKQTRQLDPGRPVICSSEYSREAELYNELLKPNDIDDGDADDLHRYNNWYGPSSFIVDAKLEKESQANGGLRPLMGQEMSTGYPDLDNGLPVKRYTHDLLTPQAWVGTYAYPGNDPSIFLEHHRAVTKRWAERLRFERSTNTAGFMLFAAECWFSHSYDVARATAYPVLSAMREAFAPIGLALETGRRRFFSGEEIDSAVFITNDDEHFADLAQLRLEFRFLDPQQKKVLNKFDGRAPNALPYYATERVPVRIVLPRVTNRSRLVLEVRLLAGGKEVSRTTDFLEVFPPLQLPKVPQAVYERTLGPEMNRFLKSMLLSNPSTEPESASLMLLGPADTLAGLEPGGTLRKALESGATLIVFSPDQKLSALFPTDIGEPKVAPGEYADFSPCAGTPLSRGLEPMDLKWWGHNNDWRVYVADTSHRLRTRTRARELIRYIPPHSYISAEKIPEQYRTVLFEIPLGRGRLWVCDLDLEASVGVDPTAQQFARNLVLAGIDPTSTAKLPKLVGHEERSESPAKKQQ